MKKIAVMQPYFFPYIGYFQLIKSCDVFVFYDDVQFIKGGWVNRNNFLINGNKNLITIPLIKASSNKRINEIKVDSKNFNCKKILKTINLSYSKAPYFDEVFPLIHNVLSSEEISISNLSSNSVKAVTNYLNIQTEFRTSSLNYSSSLGLDRTDRLIRICKTERAIKYINPIGGNLLYDKSIFKKMGITLSFITSQPIEYKQFKDRHIPNMSMIDVLMFNSKEKCLEYLDKYSFS